MARSPSLGNDAPPRAESEIISDLERIAVELQMVRNVLDEFRTDFQWAIQNGRIVVQSAPVEQFAHQLRELTLFSEGEAVEFDLGGEIAFGEVVEINDGLNRAVVQLIPSGDIMTVRQDDLRKVVPDQLARTQPSEPRPIIEPVGELPEPGELF